MYLRGEFVDVVLICAGQTFQAHRAMLAAHSDIFKKGLLSMPTAVHGSRPEIAFSDIGNADAVKVMLDYVYKIDLASFEERNPKTLQAIVTDVLRLASHFELPGLRSVAARWLLAGVTTGNVLERLATCEEFGLEDIRTRILRHLAKDKEALSQVSSSKHLMQNPQLLQELLQQAADEPQPKRKAKSGEPSAAPKKKARKA
jgi:speckle-type POZ protein